MTVLLCSGYLELNENGNVTGAVHYFNQSHQLGDTDATHNLAVIQTYYEAFDPDPVSYFVTIICVRLQNCTSSISIRLGTCDEFDLSFNNFPLIFPDFQYYAHKMFKIASERGHKDATMISAEQTLHGLHNQTGNCSSALKLELFHYFDFRL